LGEARVARRLAAVFAADVAGYSRLMGADEEGTLRRLQAHRRELIDPKVREHKGRIVKTTGDGMLGDLHGATRRARCYTFATKRCYNPPGAARAGLFDDCGDMVVCAAVSPEARAGEPLRLSGRMSWSALDPNRTLNTAPAVSPIATSARYRLSRFTLSAGRVGRSSDNAVGIGFGRSSGESRNHHRPEDIKCYHILPLSLWTVLSESDFCIR
jgi:hypothetical protein